MMHFGLKHSRTCGCKSCKDHIKQAVDRICCLMLDGIALSTQTRYIKDLVTYGTGVVKMATTIDYTPCGCADECRKARTANPEISHYAAGIARNALQAEEVKLQEADELRREEEQKKSNRRRRGAEKNNGWWAVVACVAVLMMILLVVAVLVSRGACS